MSDVVIRVENLGKRYRIGERVAYLTLRDTLARAFASGFRNLTRAESWGSASSKNELWALKEVSFEIRQGEVVGIIGSNGAGKSTLLKILSRITKPTVGQAQIRGRFGSLLEVGTGFHPELTGRENTYLNGAILGMSRKDIIRRFDEIVAFAEIERFIDTPVKYYSSGMYVRLAFSVAAHLEPEILMVDEVLAVGDVAFQKKCLGRMGDVARQGRTVLFVSHNLSAVALLCKSVIVLEHGRVKTIGTADRAIAEYLTSMVDHGFNLEKLDRIPRRDESLHREVEFMSLALEDFPAKLIPADSDLALSITLKGRETVDDFSFYVRISEATGAPVGSCLGATMHSIQEGEVARYRLQLPNPRLAPGRYRMDLAVGTGNEGTGFRLLDALEEILLFEVMAPPGQNGTVSEWHRTWGTIRFPRPTSSKCD